VSDGADRPRGGSTEHSDLEILVTASEAYPRLEALFLAARGRIDMGFRLFDPRTQLQSDAARAVGDTWLDLFLHTLNRGVSIDLILSDFDPVMAHEMHEQAWHFVAMLTALNELSLTGAARMTARCILHPAKGGIVPRLMFAARTRKELQRVVRDLNESPDPERRLRFAPGLHGLLEYQEGRVRAIPRAVPLLYPITLHHKMAVFDRSTTYIGGLDLNERRVDDAAHDLPAQETWHDTQLVSQDPALAKDACAFLKALPDVIDRKGSLPHPTSAFRTTLSRRRARDAFSLAPENVSDSLLDEHLKQIGQAREFIYLETQYFRDRRTVAALVAAGKRSKELRLVVLVPAAPESVAFSDAPGLDARFGEYLQGRGMRRLNACFGDRFLAVSPVQPRKPDARDATSERATLAGAPIVYVHSKVSIFDGTAAIVSSANLNGRSMKWDAEAGLVISQAAQVQALSNKIFRHWLAQEGDIAPTQAFDLWKQRALANASLPPQERQGFVVPYDMKPNRRGGTALPGAPEEMV
jgi:phospholipase D1/2